VRDTRELIRMKPVMLFAKKVQLVTRNNFIGQMHDVNMEGRKVQTEDKSVA
jgi:hypothetical protein